MSLKVFFLFTPPFYRNIRHNPFIEITTQFDRRLFVNYS